MDAILEHFPVGPLGCVCTIAGDPETGEAVVVDGGADADEVTRRLARRGLRATHLLHTHAHVDHVGACAALREATGAPAALHPEDLPLAATLDRQARMLGIAPVAPLVFDDEIHDGDEIRAGSIRVATLHTPGHTPGSCCFALTLGARRVVLSGDTLFRGAVGRWDLGGTSLEDIVTSIRRKLLPLDDATTVVPGHGPRTTIGRERAENPYLL